MELTISELFKTIKDNEKWTPIKSGHNVKYIERVGEEIRIEAIDRRFPMIVKDNVKFRKVEE